MRSTLAGLAIVGGVFACGLAAPAARAASIAGEWRLVEQTYGAGQSNLVAGEANPLRLEFYRSGATLDGRLRAGEGGGVVLPWPRLVADETRAVHVEAKRVSAAEDAVFVRYRVDPPPGDDLVLEITEEYRLVDDGRALAGTVRVRFLREGQDRGSYTLLRRFDRER